MNLRAAEISAASGERALEPQKHPLECIILRQSLWRDKPAGWPILAVLQGWGAVKHAPRAFELLSHPALCLFCFTFCHPERGLVFARPAQRPTAVEGSLHSRTRDDAGSSPIRLTVNHDQADRASNLRALAACFRAPHPCKTRKDGPPAPQLKGTTKVKTSATGGTSAHPAKSAQGGAASLYLVPKKAGPAPRLFAKCAKSGAPTPVIVSAKSRSTSSGRRWRRIAVALAASHRCVIHWEFVWGQRFWQRGRRGLLLNKDSKELGTLARGA